MTTVPRLYDLKNKVWNTPGGQGLKFAFAMQGQADPGQGTKTSHARSI